MADALTDRTTADAAYAASEAAETVLSLLNRAHLMLAEMEGASDFFMGATALLPDVISDLQAMKAQADEAIGEYDVMKAYGERPSQVAPVADGASL